MHNVLGAGGGADGSNEAEPVEGPDGFRYARARRRAEGGRFEVGEPVRFGPRPRVARRPYPGALAGNFVDELPRLTTPSPVAVSSTHTPLFAEEALSNDAGRYRELVEEDDPPAHGAPGDGLRRVELPVKVDDRGLFVAEIRRGKAGAHRASARSTRRSPRIRAASRRESAPEARCARRPGFPLVSRLRSCCR